MSVPYQGGKLTCKVLIGWSFHVQDEGAGKVDDKIVKKKKQSRTNQGCHQE